MRNFSRIWTVLVVGATLAVTFFCSIPVRAVPLSNTNIDWTTFTSLADLSNPVGIPFIDTFEFSGGPQGEIISAVFPGIGNASGLYVYVYQLKVYTPPPTGKVDELSVPIKGPFSFTDVLRVGEPNSFYIGSGVPSYFLYGQGDKAPSSAALSFNVVSWSWPDPNYIPNDESSYIVGYFSPVIPTKTYANLSDSGQETKFPLVYTPSPEPSIGLLMGVGLLGGCIFWRRKRILK